MNPRVSSRKKKSAFFSEPPAAAAPQQSLLAQLMNGPISSAVAIAIVVFAAGSTMAITALVYNEIALSTGEVPLAHHLSFSHSPAVLGESVTNIAATIDDAALEAGDPSAAISAKPLSFDSTAGRWSYSISYQLANVTSPATLSIGAFPVASNLTVSGAAQTGPILKPGRSYVVSLWAQDSSGLRQRLARTEIRTPKARASTTLPPPCLHGDSSLSASSSTASLKPCPLPLKQENSPATEHGQKPLTDH